METKTISKYAHTEYNRYNRVASRIKDNFSTSVIFRSTFEQWMARNTEIHKSADYKRLSGYYKGKISGIGDALWSSLYGWIGDNPPLLMSVLYGPDGRMFVTDGGPNVIKDDSWLAEDAAYKNSMTCRHIWRKPYMEHREVKMWA